VEGSALGVRLSKTPAAAVGGLAWAGGEGTKIRVSRVGKHKMGLSQGVLLFIFEQASSLAGSFFGHGGADGQPRPGSLVAQRLERWAQSAAAGHADQFDRRLRWDGLERHTVRAALGHARCRGHQPLPAWTDTLSAVVAQAWAIDPEQLCPYTALRPDAPVPF